MRLIIEVKPAKRSGYSGFVNGEQIAVGTLSSVAKNLGDEVKDQINKHGPSIQQEEGGAD